MLRAVRRWLRLWLVLLVIAVVSLILLLTQFPILPAALLAPRVVALTPADDSTEIALTSPITVTFSTIMDRAAVQGAVSAHPSFETRFTWLDDRTLVLSPASTLPVSTTVTLRVNQNARSWLQRELESPFEARFSTLSRPVVVDSRPDPAARYYYQPDRVVIIFNRSMDRPSVSAQLTLTPTVPFLEQAWNDRTLTLFGFFQPHTRYQLTLAGSAVDSQHGLALDRAWTWSFTTTLQYPHLAIHSPGRYLSFAPGQPAVVPLHLVNLSRLDVTLFRIDAVTFARLLNAPFDAWNAYAPDAPALNQWSIDPAAPLDQLAHYDLGTSPLPAGLYYMRLAAPEGPRDAQLLVVTTLDLALTRTRERAQVEARTAAGAPVAHLSLTLYNSSGDPVLQGTTDAQGRAVFELPCPRTDGPECLDWLTVLGVRNDEPAFATTRPQQSSYSKQENDN